MLTNIETKQGYLYLLKNTLLGGHKIGITTAPESRFKSLEVGTKAELLGYWPSNHYRELEKHFHKYYAEHRVPQSEWFVLDESQVVEFIQLVTSCAIPEFIEQNYIEYIQDLSPKFRFVSTPPYEAANKANWNYFGLLVIVSILSYLTAAIT